ncbi:NAD(P)-dependent oxidoreductase [Asanoa sp. NPDC049573]|uniref:NAD-dependent epimerase/dehydratase family protein n=1 Tax=Asanoa sp. NPDC049573 TaxID=3155396 RepID=UPI0034444B65
MKVFLAGGTGVLGIPLTRRLLAAGHEVIGLTRGGAGPATLAALGARPVVADALDRTSLLRAVDGMSADAVVHELTALRAAPTRHRGMVPTDRLREAGTANLLAAAESLGAGRFVTQSIILGYGYRDHGDRVLTEDDPFGQAQGDACDPHLAAMRATEQQAFTAPAGIALRYGMFYGGDPAEKRALLARRRLPVSRGGLLGWIHHDDAAAATVLALEAGRAGQAYNIVDDRPASWADLFTAMAAAYGTPAPPRLPPWLFRLAAPYVATFAIDTSMRVSNAKAARELGWRPAYPSYVEGLTPSA